MSPVWHRVRVALAVILLLALSVSGFWGVDKEWRYATSWAAESSTFMQAAYAVLGLVAAALLLFRLRGTRPVLYVWAFALVLTGATAPVIWGQAGWESGFFAACLMGVVSGSVIWLAPLPEVQGVPRRWRWLLAGFFTFAAAGVLMTVVRVAPTVVHGRSMEAFCAGLPGGLDRQGFTDMAERQGYIVTPGGDAKGGFLRLDDDRSGGHYHCEARFNPDGRLKSMSFTGKADAQ